MNHFYKLPISFKAMIGKDRLKATKRLVEAKEELAEQKKMAIDKTKSEGERESARSEVKELEGEIRSLEDEISAKDSPRGTLKESIADKLHLILITHFGEYRYDHSFGSSLWEHDFEMLSDFDRWQEEIQSSVRKTVEINEARLSNVEVRVDITQEEFFSEKAVSQKIKLKVGMKINARIRQTNEAFYFSESLYVSPISFD